ncbi:MAG: dihydropyrimidinase [Planctomycetes bacterium]|jgi:dihydropyrimidinase|nr:dihydropyrimidinase [Planctomycetota bacterium]HPY74440.1 dihydropyrimidinase [Planctomycetota bacterium]HQA99991.1 dihydropyrimidinase [Planctomycetota bacterium]
MDLIIKNGTIVTASDMYIADLGVQDGVIVQIARCISENGAKIVDASDCFVFPGMVDAHVHFSLPVANTVTSDDFTNGTKAAACGGITTILDFVTPAPQDSLMEAIKARRKEADGNVCIDYGLHAGITNWSSMKHEIDAAFEAGICSFKMFMTYKERGLMSDDQALFEALEVMKKKHGMISVHAESSPVLDVLAKRYEAEYSKHGIHGLSLCRPDIIEVEAVERAIRWAELSGGRLYIVHLSTAEGRKIVREARERGVDVFAETCPQYLFLDDTVFDKQDGHLYSSCPQIKSKANQEGLWKGIYNRDISVVATDHCGFTKAQKNMWGGNFTKLPFGVPSIETVLSLMYTEGVLKRGISLHHLVQLMSYNPARIYGMYPHKGTIAIGSDADIVIFDPNYQGKIDCTQLQTNCDWSPYQNMKYQGIAKMTISRGKILAEYGKYIGEEKKGKYLYRPASFS